MLSSADIEFTMPPEQSAFTITERLVGTTTTDFGAPDVAPESDSRPVDETELQQLLQAYWQAFDTAVERAEGKVLRKGARGGGRETAQIVQHVLPLALNQKYTPVTPATWQKRTDVLQSS